MQKLVCRSLNPSKACFALIKSLIKSFLLIKLRKLQGRNQAELLGFRLFERLYVRSKSILFIIN